MQVVEFDDDHAITDALPSCTAAGFADDRDGGSWERMAGAGGGGASSPPWSQPDSAASAPSVQIIARRFTIIISM